MAFSLQEKEPRHFDLIQQFGARIKIDSSHDQIMCRYVLLDQHASRNVEKDMDLKRQYPSQHIFYRPYVLCRTSFVLRKPSLNNAFVNTCLISGVDAYSSSLSNLSKLNYCQCTFLFVITLCQWHAKLTSSRSVGAWWRVAKNTYYLSLESRVQSMIGSRVNSRVKECSSCRYVCRAIVSSLIILRRSLASYGLNQSLCSRYEIPTITHKEN